MEINEELKNYVINSLPINLTKLEQAIFIYILLCKYRYHGLLLLGARTNVIFTVKLDTPRFGTLTR